MPVNKKKSDDSFFEDVYEVVRLVPAGRVTTYGAIAAYLGAKSSSRMVGWAMNGCPADVPAHRVVNRIGLLSGKHHFQPPEEMERRLVKEGISVRKDQVEKFQDLFWDPARELMP
jgi:methylated-DNA-protein-cysteine methyltransferase related protein